MPYAINESDAEFLMDALKRDRNFRHDFANIDFNIFNGLISDRLVEIDIEEQANNYIVTILVRNPKTDTKDRVHDFIHNILRDSNGSAVYID